MAALFKTYQKFVLKHKIEENAEVEESEILYNVMPNIVKFAGLNYLKRFQNAHASTFKVDTL